MAYIPTEWKTGDIVTAEKLNKIENFLANLEPSGGVLRVNTTKTTEEQGVADVYTFTSDKTASELLAADTVIIHMDLSDLFGFEGDYYVININDWGASEGTHEFQVLGSTPWMEGEAGGILSFQENADTGFISYQISVLK